MKKYLLPENGQFYKANLHTHTKISDGVYTPEEIKKIYLENGYSIVAFTDHEVMISQNHLTDADFLAINAVETITSDKWAGGYCYNKTYHLNFYAKKPDITHCPVLSAKNIWQEHTKAYATEEMIQHPYKNHYSIAGVNDAIQKAAEAGFLVCLNHPVWSSQDYTDYMGLKGLWGVEVFNTGCYRGGMHDTPQPMMDLLRAGESVMPVAADDTHSPRDLCQGWVQVKADRLEYETVMEALERGEFYASIGPEIKDLYIEDGMLHITTSDAVSIALISNYRYFRKVYAGGDAPLNEAVFNLKEFVANNKAHEYPKCEAFVRLEVRDAVGNFAWTRGYRLHELEEN